MSEGESLYQSPGEQGKRGFEDLECYQLALEVMALVYDFSKTLIPSTGISAKPNSPLTVLCPIYVAKGRVLRTVGINELVKAPLIMQ